MIVLALKKFADLKQYLHIANLVNKYCIDGHSKLNSRKSFGKKMKSQTHFNNIVENKGKYQNN